MTGEADMSTKGAGALCTLAAITGAGCGAGRAVSPLPRLATSVGGTPSIAWIEAGSILE